MDLETLSDEELDKLVAKKQQDELDSLSDDELDKLVLQKASASEIPIQEQEKSTLQSIYEPVEAALMKASNTAFMGYRPQIEGATRSAGKALLEGRLPTEEDYIRERDQAIKVAEEVEQRDPIPSMIGTGAGIAASMLAPASVVTKGPALMKAAGAAGMGLAQSFLQNPGDVQGEIDPLQAKARAEQASDPLSLGMSAAPLVFNGIGQIVKKVSNTNPAYKAAFKASMPSVKKYQEALKEAGQKSIDNIGKFAIDNGIVKFGDKVEDIYYKASDFAEKVGKEISDVYSRNTDAIEKWLVKNAGTKQAQEFTSKLFSFDNNKKQIMADISEKLAGNEGKQAAMDRMEKYLASLKEDFGNEPGLIQLQRIKTKIGQEVKDWAKSPNESPAFKNAMRSLYGRFSEAIDNEIAGFSQIVGGDDAKILKDLNKSYSLATDLEMNALKGTARSEMKTDSSNALSALGGILGYSVGKDPAAALGGAAVGKVIGMGANYLQGRTEGIKANILNPIINKPESRAIMSPLRSYLGYKQSQNNEQMYEQFPESLTQPVQDEVQAAQMEKMIDMDPSLKPSQKAARLNLLRKYGRVYIGQ